MVKKIVIPIVAAIIVMIAGLCAVAIIYNYDGNVKYEAHVVVGNFSSSTDDIYIVYSYDEFIQLCKKHGAHFVNEDRLDCECYMCTKLRNYDTNFFKKNALIITNETTVDTGSAFAVNKIKSENQTLKIELFQVDFGGLGWLGYWGLFFDVNKADIQGITNIEKSITTVKYYDLPPSKELIAPTGFKKSYWQDAIREENSHNHKS